jgi:hypothetical protein
MALPGIGSVGVSSIAGGGTPQPTTQKFSAALKTAQGKPGPAAKPAAAPAKPAAPVVGKTLDQLSAAQSRMDKVLELAQSGKTFTPAELLSLQTQVYRASQELDLAGKVVEKATGGVKQVLQTQV